MRQPFRWIPLVSLTLLGLLVAATTLAPGVSYTSITSVEVSGLVGNLLKKAGTDALSEESFFTETTMATKNKTSRSLIDLNAETITSVNDVTKTYTVIPFAQVGAMVAPGGEPAQAEPEEDTDYTVSVEFWIDDLGVVSDPSGATHLRLHIVADPEPNKPDLEDPGQYALVMELFVKDVEGYEIVQAFRRGYAEKLGRAMGGGQGNLFDTIKKVLGDSPGIRESLERSSEEIAKLDKMAVRQILHVVTVPPEMEYDPEKVFAKKEKKKKKKRLGRFAKKIANQATGSGTDNEAQDQKTVLTSTTNHEGFTTGPIDATVFEIGSDYEQTQYYGTGGN